VGGGEGCRPTCRRGRMVLLDCWRHPY
jgi:hypothetical protein